MNDTALFRPLLLRATNINKRFGALRALNGFALDVQRNSITSLIGPNGAGKSIFFALLTGIYKPDSGDIWFNGQDLLKLPANQITELGIARTFQNIRLFSNMTVLENVLVGEHCRIHGNILGAIFHTRDEIREEEKATARAMDLLDFVGMRSLAYELAKNLSYGSQRRLEIVRALASDPTLLLLDEPTAGMNPQETVALMSLIARLRRDLNMTILLVEHDMRMVMRVSDRVTVLESGVKISEGTPDEVRADPRVIETYLGRPAVVG